MKYLRRWYALFLLLASTDAWATTRYVSPTGDGGVYTFATPGGLDSANIVSVAGDVVILKRGTYTTAISPSNHGSPSSRITFLANISAPDSTSVPSTTIDKRFISVKGIKCVGTFSFNYYDSSGSNVAAQWDSLLYSTITTSLEIRGAAHCKVYRTNVTSGNGRLQVNGGWVSGGAALVQPKFNRVSRCSLSLGAQVTSGDPITLWVQAYSDTVDSNYINISTTAVNQNFELDPFIMKWSGSNRFFDNKWVVQNNLDQPRLFRLRDSTNHVTFVRDTMLFSGYDTRLSPSVHGAGGIATALPYSNRFDYLYYKNNTTSQSAIYYQDRMRGDTLTNCAVFCENGRALWIVGGADSMGGGTARYSVIDHCTFVGAQVSEASAFSIGGVVMVDAVQNAWTPGASIQYTNNIIYQRQKATSDHEIGWGFYSDLDTIFTSNNMYYGEGKIQSRCISFNQGGSTQQCSPTVGSSFNTYKTGCELNSLWGDPLLTETTYNGFDVTLASNSPARNRGTNGTDIGVYFAPTPTGDNIRPYALAPYIGDSRSNQVTVTWTATGDDSLSGTATSYDIRYSTTAINNESDWSSAIQCSGEPTPRIAGTLGESFTVNGLTNRTFYYIVVRSVDDVGNMSALHPSVCAYPPFYCE